MMELGNAVPIERSETFGVKLAVSLLIVLALFAMLIYLIYLRRARIQTEEWLELNKNTLFNQKSNLRTEEEILEALTKYKESREENGAGDKSTGSSNDRTAPSDNENQSMTGSLLPKKQFKDEQ